MSTYEERAEEARDEARARAHCMGCALGLPHDSDQCDADENE